MDQAVLVRVRLVSGARQRTGIASVADSVTVRVVVVRAGLLDGAEVAVVRRTEHAELIGDEAAAAPVDGLGVGQRLVRHPARARASLP